MCLATARTVILERRPLSMVARVIDVLVSSYAHSLKTGSYFKGARAEKMPASSTPRENTPAAGDIASASRATITGKSLVYGTANLEGESFCKSASSGSDLEENDTMGFLRTDSNIGTSKVPIGAETPRTEVRPYSLQTDYDGTKNNLMSTSVSKLQEPQLASPAISPDEMYSFVFCPVEEEMAGDPSYLVAIMIEFLRRYAFIFLKNEMYACFYHIFRGLSSNVIFHEF